MSPTLFTVWQFQVQKKFSPETKLQPKAVKIYTFSLSNLMTQLFKVKTPANLVTSCFWTGSSALVWISHRCSYLGHVGLSWVIWGPHFTLASASHVAAVQGCLLQDNEMDWIIFVTNANKKTDNLEGCLDKDLHNSHTNFWIEHRFWRSTAYLFIGYHFLHWLYLDNHLLTFKFSVFNYC